MSELAAALEEYLAVRRAVGYKLVLSGYVLRGFVAEMDRPGVTKVTTSAALAWAVSPAGAHPAWHAQRLGMARCFARFLHAIDPAHQVPPPGLLPAKARRGTRRLMSGAEIGAVMTAAALLRPELRAATCHTLIGLLTVSGIFSGGTDQDEPGVLMDRLGRDMINKSGLAAEVLHMWHVRSG